MVQRQNAEPKKPEPRLLRVYIDQDLKRQLKTFAASTGRSMNKVIEDLIQRHVASN